MTRSALQALPGSSTGLVRKYVDKNGRKRIVGLGDKLRQSQPLVCNTRVDLHRMGINFKSLRLALFCIFSYLSFITGKKLHQGLYARVWAVHRTIGYRGYEGARCCIAVCMN